MLPFGFGPDQLLGLTGPFFRLSGKDGVLLAEGGVPLLQLTAKAAG